MYKIEVEFTAKEWFAIENFLHDDFRTPAQFIAQTIIAYLENEIDIERERECDECSRPATTHTCNHHAEFARCRICGEPATLPHCAACAKTCAK